jgi:phage pi2 protein 07
LTKKRVNTNDSNYIKGIEYYIPDKKGGHVQVLRKEALTYVDKKFKKKYEEYLNDNKR